MSNSQHGIGNLARLPNMHTSCPTLNTGWEFGKTSEYAHKRCNSPPGKGNLERLPNIHTRGVTQHGINESARLPNVHTRGPARNTG
ncbi:hypothetical protein PoB_003928400 [Plakobranchus ocellatus]|uniref:Uncharacterized protein n=1 Tax=Plakobranchus ocellatus TaxID=259542 RepID=A0AAV4B340_9GAST|nr:hypothetical protein PoB_003928400 [Plakobranchus ocellatus]